MSEVTAVVKANGNVPAPVVPQVDQIAELKAQLAAVMAELVTARTPKEYTGALYGIVEPTEGYTNPAMKLTLPSGGKAIMGPRRKFTDLIEEVKSGRLEAFLTAHPEVK